MVTKLVGKRIAQLRHRLGLSQVAFAEQIGMARTYFAEVETGKRNASVRNLERITSGLGVTLAEFFDSDIFDPLYRPVERKANKLGEGARSEQHAITYAYVALPPLENQGGKEQEDD
ncbi:MAG: helix-turn-helix transcriptional regulator [Eggerthellaceae bacterium]|nr:helix-turn-helix transcriptional regulator [Eggerthellaceae bacterium]